MLEEVGDLLVAGVPLGVHTTPALSCGKVVVTKWCMLLWLCEPGYVVAVLR